jgi:phage terminase large subunit-like protein
MKAAALQYIADVMNGTQTVGKLARLAVERHVNDLKTGIDRGLFFDERAGAKALNLFKFLKHTKGSEFAGKPFVLSPWEAFIIWVLFGWKKADGSRRFNYAYVEVAKKNGKSTFAAGIALNCFIADKEPGAEIYTAASNRDQAKIVFTEAKNMVRASAELKGKITIYEHSLFTDYPLMSTFRPLSSDQDSFEGKNPSCTIFDEYHVQKTNDLFDNIKSAMGARKNPLLFIITTAGKSRTSPCYDYRAMVIDILTGIKQQDNLFGTIYTLDEGDDWQNPAVWIKSNPNLGESVNLNFLENELLETKNRESAVINFKTKNLNIWTDSAKGWIPDEKWMLCAGECNKDALKGQLCYGGLDLASSVDINALVLFFPVQMKILCWFWIPDEKVKQKEDRVDYRLWANQGFINVTEGAVIDIDQMSADILKIMHTYDCKSTAIDPAKAYNGIVQNLQKENITLSLFRQGFLSMSEPTKLLEKLILGRQISHGGNPVLRWMNTNVELSRDAAENIKIDKAKSTNKVDGMVAFAMALGEHMTQNQSNLLNETLIKHGVRTI